MGSPAIEPAKTLSDINMIKHYDLVEHGLSVHLAER